LQTLKQQILVRDEPWTEGKNIQGSTPLNRYRYLAYILRFKNVKDQMNLSCTPLTLFKTIIYCRDLKTAQITDRLLFFSEAADNDNEKYSICEIHESIQEQDKNISLRIGYRYQTTKIRVQSRVADTDPHGPAWIIIIFGS
jgi:hypothetical protein